MLFSIIFVCAFGIYVTFAFLLIVQAFEFLKAFVYFPYLLVAFFYSLSIAELNVFFAEMVQ